LRSARDDESAEKGTSALGASLLIAAVLAAIVVYLFQTVPDYLATAPGGDHPYYVEIARGGFDNHAAAPWRYRVLYPYLAALVRSTGASTSVSFFIVTLAFAFASCVLMRAFLRQLSVSTFAATAGALLFTVSVGAYVPLRRGYGYPDTVTNFFVLLALTCLAANRRAAVAAALGVGAFAKESMLLVVPFVAARLWAARERLVTIVAVLFPPILVFVVLRVVMAPVDGSSSLALTWQAQVDYWKTAMVNGVARWILWSIAYSMGPVWLLAAIAVPRNWTFVRDFGWYVLPLVAPLVRTTDTERALMLSFPLVFALAANAIDGVGRARHRATIVALVTACVLGSQMTWDWSPTMRLGIVNAKDLVFLALSLTVLALVWRPSLDASPALAWPRR
jgi:hypothetical protein